jgi:hypothetical protein
VASSPRWGCPPSHNGGSRRSSGGCLHVAPIRPRRSWFRANGDHGACDEHLRPLRPHPLRPHVRTGGRPLGSRGQRNRVHHVAFRIRQPLAAHPAAAPAGTRPRRPGRSRVPHRVRLPLMSADPSSRIPMTPDVGRTSRVVRESAPVQVEGDKDRARTVANAPQIGRKGGRLGGRARHARPVEGTAREVRTGVPAFNGEGPRPWTVGMRVRCFRGSSDPLEHVAAAAAQLQRSEQLGGAVPDGVGGLPLRCPARSATSVPPAPGVCSCGFSSTQSTTAFPVGCR